MTIIDTTEQLKRLLNCGYSEAEIKKMNVVAEPLVTQTVAEISAGCHLTKHSQQIQHQQACFAMRLGNNKSLFNSTD